MRAAMFVLGCALGVACFIAGIRAQRYNEARNVVRRFLRQRKWAKI